MNKKLHSAINIIILVVACLTLFAGCTVNKVNPWEIEKDLNWVGKIVQAMHGWIGSYGWTVVIFTVFLKLLMLPLDIWQRVSTRKMAVKMQIMQPYVAEIDKRYGANSQKGAEEKQKLFKKYGYSMTSSCLPMIITMVVFFIMFGGLRSYSTYSSVQTFNALSQTYSQTFAQKVLSDKDSLAYKAFADKYLESQGVLAEDGSYNAETPYNQSEYNKISAGIVAVQNEIVKLQTANEMDKATELSNYLKTTKAEVLVAVQNKYNDIEEGWLWIQNIAQPDTWESIMPQYDSGTNSFTSLVDMSNYDADSGKNHYNTIRNAVLETGKHEGGKWNGYMILPILSIALSFLSMFISQRLERKNQAPVQDQQQKSQNTMMMIMMPLMMAYFGFIYTGAFAIYMVVNYLISILSTVLLRAPVEKIVQKNIAKTSSVDNGKANYMR